MAIFIYVLFTFFYLLTFLTCKGYTTAHNEADINTTSIIKNLPNSNSNNITNLTLLLFHKSNNSFKFLNYTSMLYNSSYISIY
jgi:hypothetical protein